MKRITIAKTMSNGKKKDFESDLPAASDLAFAPAETYQTGESASRPQAPHPGLGALHTRTSFNMLVASDVGGMGYSYVV